MTCWPRPFQSGTESRLRQCLFRLLKCRLLTRLPIHSALISRLRCRNCLQRLARPSRKTPAATRTPATSTRHVCGHLPSSTLPLHPPHRHPHPPSRHPRPYPQMSSNPTPSSSSSCCRLPHPAQAPRPRRRPSITTAHLVPKNATPAIDLPARARGRLLRRAVDGAAIEAGDTGRLALASR